MSKSNKIKSQKHLTIDEREIIELCLKENFTFVSIAQKVQKDRRTISKEIQKHRIRKEPSSFNNRFNFCSNRRNCHLKNICEKNCHTECRNCNLCNALCKDYEEDLCERLKRSPYVCNGCENYTHCRKIKYIYRSKEAHNQYLDELKNSRTGINMSQDELEKLDKLITPLIRQGQSISHIYVNHKNEIPCGIRCLYNYVDKKILTVRNIDLRRKVKYKKRKKQKKPKKDTTIRIGRTYEDFKNFIAENPDVSIVEMDTVEGTKGGKVLLTLLFRKFNFMLAFIMPDKTSQSVITVFNDLTDKLGVETFKNLFGYILTDNGTEFSNPIALEKTVDKKERCKIYYCNAYRSEQKRKNRKKS